MQKIFSHIFSHHIWRILPDSNPDSGLWIIELRNVQEKKVSFALIDLNAQLVQWEVCPETTDWWTSVTAFGNGHVFLHNYRFPDIPEPTDLLMISADRGELVWVAPNYVLVKTLNETEIMVATKASEGFKHFKSNAATGQITESVEYPKQPERSIILGEPVRYKNGEKYFDQLVSFIEDQVAGHVPVSIDYLEKRPIMMFSYYIYEQGKMAEYLLVVSNKLERIHHEKLSEGRDGVGQATMFLKGSRLVFVKNNNEFSSLTLSQ